MTMTSNRMAGTTEARQLEIHSVVGNLEHAAKAVDELTSKIIERVSSIVANRPEPAGGPGQPPRAPRATALGARIDAATSIIEDTGLRLQGLLDRLEV